MERSGETGLWRLTAMGHAILDHPQLSKSVERAIDGLNLAQRVRLAKEIGESGAGAAPGAAPGGAAPGGAAPGGKKQDEGVIDAEFEDSN